MIQIEELDQIEKFSLGVENIAKAGNTYIDSILEYCVKYDIELEIVPKLLSPSLKNKINKEALKKHLVKSNGIRRLPT